MSIIIENLNHLYDVGTPYETNALNDVSLTIPDGIFAGIIGHTGSGKSTLIQHLNGLLKPSSGKILIGDFDLTAKNARMIDIRRKIGLVFQYPEYQLFEETVYKDISYGPRNLGLSEEEVDTRVRRSMQTVGLDFDMVAEKSPFELSGGQKRRVAIAGVIAMEPQVLILDEPTAGLDPKGRDEIFESLKELHRSKGITVILVSHSMEDVAQYVDFLYVMHHGKVVYEGAPKDVFQHQDELRQIGLDVPQVTSLAYALQNKGIQIEQMPVTVTEMKELILERLRKKKC